jgi:TetR/AcrR family transcriptional regulator, transcriptional repressor for nem operon
VCHVRGLLANRYKKTREDKLKLHIDTYVNTPSFPGGCPLLNFAVDADDGNLALRIGVRKALKGWEDLPAKIVEDGQSAEEIDPDIDAHSVANLVISTLEGSAVLARINKRPAARGDAGRLRERESKGLSVRSYTVSVRGSAYW